MMQMQHPVDVIGKRSGAVPGPGLASDADRWDEILMQTFPASDPPPWPGSVGGASAGERAGRRDPEIADAIEGN